MVIANLDLQRIAALPDKADAPLVVDADCVLAGAVSGEPLEAVARRAAQVDKVVRVGKHAQLAQRDGLDFGRQALGEPAVEHLLGLGVAKRLDHALMV